MSKENNKTTIIKLALILFAITFFATLALTLCNHLTQNRIAALAEINAEKAKQEVISDASFEEIDIDMAEFEALNILNVFKADKNGEFAGYCVNVEPAGFGGGINMFVGIGPDLETITGIKIISMSETPGLGAKAQEEAFSGQFASGKKAPLTVVKNASSPKENEIDAISGATITSDAVVLGVNNAVEAVKAIDEKEGK